MTKKESILEAALDLFSTLGYSGTSTRMIAKKAEVSEGLIFRHFNNKEGMLHALLDNAKEEMSNLYVPILASGHPKVFLKQILSVPFQIKEKNAKLWRFLYSHQWYEPKMIMLSVEPLQNHVFDSFKTLGASDPQSETEAFLIFYEGLIRNILLKHDFNAFPVAEYILRKFDL